MADKFGGLDEEEDNVLVSKEPQIDASEPGERKAARQLRIKRRQEALKRAEQPLEEATADEEPGEIEQATAAAAEELQRLALDGAAKVTNVKVTTDEREVIRRALVLDNMQNAFQKLEEEAALAQIQYEAISSNWDVILAVKDPLDIDAEMKEQKRKCDALLNQKDDVIEDLKAELKKMDIAYYDDLDKQDKDIKELSDRVEKQVTIMQRAYEKQLFLIEQAINIERDAMVDHNNKRWEALYKQRDREEVSHLDIKFEQLEEQKVEIAAIMWDHHEKFREAKIELESLIQELQKELEKLKAVCMINTEKIGYNYQVLKKREEENVFVRSQQKRKLNKMSDVANKLRASIRKAAEDGAIEEVKSDAEIVKLIQTMDDLEKKSNQFSHVNHYKFSQVWRMAAAKCSELVRELRQGEVAIHAHILAEPAPPPPPPPPMNPLAKYEHDEVAVLLAPGSDEVVDPKNAMAKDARDKLVRHILQLVADNTGFLVEDRVLKLIEKYDLTARNLCTLDAIFMALEIQAEEDIELLCKTFLNYAFCPICVGLEATSDIETHPVSPEESNRQLSGKPRGDRLSIRGRVSIARSLSVSTSRSHFATRSHDLSAADQELITEADEILLKCGGDPQSADKGITGATPDQSAAGSTKRTGARGVTVAAQPLLLLQKTQENPFLCPVGHYLEIEPMQVLTALGEFIALFVPPEKKKLYDILDSVKPPNFSTPSRRMTSEEIEHYWLQWKNIYTPEKVRFWDGLLTGLNNYLPVLQERERIHNEVCHLRKRNEALRRLVRGALPELPSAPMPKYMRPGLPNFTCTVPDQAPLAFARLPPI